MQQFRARIFFGNTFGMKLQIVFVGIALDTVNVESLYKDHFTILHWNIFGLMFQKQSLLPLDWFAPRPTSCRVHGCPACSGGGKCRTCDLPRARKRCLCCFLVMVVVVPQLCQQFLLISTARSPLKQQALSTKKMRGTLNVFHMF